jgi:methylated-DNA-[protein]-cysteine S-methyltransferase
MNKESQYCVISSPVGDLILVARDDCLIGVLWAKGNHIGLSFGDLNPAYPVLLKTKIQFHEYFSGQRTIFDIPLIMTGTDFQKKVWTALLDIPFGATQSYLQLAQKIGDIKAVRAVGAANAKNPISIIVPCHRVVGANGSLTGFSGGIETKAMLLSFESTQKSLF